MLLTLVAIAGTAIGFRSVHPFLAVTRPIGAKILVLEGWSPERAYIQMADLFRKGDYRRLLVVVAVYEGDDLFDGPGLFYDDYLGGIATKQGIPGELVHVLLVPATHRDRTFHSARVARRWLDENHPGWHGVDVATMGPHARRSRLLYERALGPASSVGVISLADNTYDPRQWWRSSEGVRDVFSESLAYLYARIFFRVPEPSPDDDLPYTIPERLQHPEP